MTKRLFLGGACPEPVEGLRMTMDSLRVDTSLEDSLDKAVMQIYRCLIINEIE